MLPEISQIHGNICEFEAKYGVIFKHEKTASAENNNLKAIHLIGNEGVKLNVANNKRIMSLLAVVDPNSNNCAVAAVVLVGNGVNFNGYEILDINSIVLASGPAFHSPPNSSFWWGTNCD